VKKINIKSRVGEIFRNELKHMSKAFDTDKPPPDEAKKPTEVGGKFNLPAFDNRAQTGTSIA